MWARVSPRCSRCSACRTHLVRGGFPDPATFPRERAAALLAEFATSGRDERVPVRADARAGRSARRARGAARGHAGTPAGRRRAADHERRDRSARARRQDVPRPGDVVVVEAPTYLGAIMAFRGFDAALVAVAMDERRAPGRRARAAARRRRAPEAALHDPRPPEPGRREPVDRAPRAARRARATARLPDRRGRRVPRARLRRRRAAEPLEPRA